MRITCFLIFSLCLLATMQTAQAQTCNAQMPASTPDSQLTDNGDGTVTDTATGLMWKKCVEGVTGEQCDSGGAATFTWQGALQRPGDVNTGGGFAGYQDWRLPNIKELTSIVEEQCHNPAINLNRFPNTPSSVVWSGSPYANYSGYAWYVDFSNGDSYFNYRNNYYQVRLVRSGQ